LTFYRGKEWRGGRDNVFEERWRRRSAHLFRGGSQIHRRKEVPASHTKRSAGLRGEPRKKEKEKKEPQQKAKKRKKKKNKKKKGTNDFWSFYRKKGGDALGERKEG